MNRASDHGAQETLIAGNVSLGKQFPQSWRVLRRNGMQSGKKSSVHKSRSLGSQGQLLCWSLITTTKYQWNKLGKEAHSFKWGRSDMFTGDMFMVVFMWEPLLFMMLYSLLRKLRLEPGPGYNPEILSLQPHSLQLSSMSKRSHFPKQYHHPETNY